VVQVTRFLFSIGVDHRDIKDENILYNPATGHIKLIDFSSASVIPDKCTQYNTFRGTEGCVPPEFYTRGCYEIRPAAVWSIGCLAYTLLKLNPPFQKKEEIVGGKIIEWDFSEDDRARDFVDQCLNYNVNRRINFDSLAKHSWFKN
jgi:serine/threonine protein kinase